MVDDVLRMRATVVSDQALAELRKIGREIGFVGQRGAPGIKAINNEFTTLSASVRRLGNELRSAVPALGGFGFGAAGVGLGVAELTRTLSGISSKIVELKYASKELGMSERDIRAWNLAAEKAGISSQSMLQGLESFKKTTDGLKYNIGGARDELYAMGAGPIVQRMQAAASQAEKMKVAFNFKEELMKADPSGFKARMFFDQIGLGADKARLTLEEFSAAQAKIKPMSQEDINRAKEFNDKLIELGHAWDQLIQKTGIALFPHLQQDIKDIQAIIGLLDKVSGWLGMDTTGNVSPFAHPWQNFQKALPKSENRNPRSGFKPTAFGDGLGAGGGLDEGSRMVKDGVFAALVEFQSYVQGGGTGGAGGFQNATFGGSAGAAGGGASGFGGGGYTNLTPGSGGGTAGGGDGGAGGNPMSRGNRNNNPGNLKFGPHARAFGATGADDKGFAVFPNRMSGEAAQETLLASNKYKGLTLDQFAQKYAEGSSDWKRTVGGALGIQGGDIVPNQDPRLAQAIRKAEGTLSPGVGPGTGTGAAAGGGTGRLAESGSVPKDVMDEARAMVKRGGSSGQVQQFMASRGYPKAGAWCGQFTASVVKEAGGTPPKGAAVASNWMNWGRKVDPGDVQEGDVMVRSRSRFGGRAVPGQTGSHVALVGQVDGKTVQMVGGNQGGIRSVSRYGEYEYRRAVPTTRMDQAVDTAATGGTKAEGNVKVSIHSDGTAARSKTETDGSLWQKTSVENYKQMQPTNTPAGRVAVGQPAFN